MAISGKYERYGNYIVNRGESLGSGKFGTVWKGYRLVGGAGEELLEGVAIKETVYQQQNIQQINTLQILNHPNIIKYIDYRISGNSLFMIMQLCEGGTLQDLLQGLPQPLDQTQLLHYYSQIVRGIRFMYEKNILHRDIKPSNILIKDGRIKIADFGTSKLKQQNEMIRTLVGTPLFASPQILELFSGQQQSYTQKSDIWSLGLILYFMFHYRRELDSPLQRLKQSLPWKGKSSLEVLYNIRNKPLEFHSSFISPELISIITKMLTVDVEQRMSFKQFFQIQLFQTKQHHKKSLPLATNRQNKMGESLVALELSQSFNCEEYELTLINQQTHQPKLLKRQTIDQQLLKLLQMRDSEDYQQKQVSDSLKLYECIRQQAQLSESKDDYSDLMLQIDCQIYQLLIMKRLILRKFTKSQRGISKTQNWSIVNLINSILDKDDQPFQQGEVLLWKRCCSIIEKHFAFSRKFQQINKVLRQILSQYLENDSIAHKQKLLTSLITPSEPLTQELKRILKKKKALFEDKSIKVEALMSRMEISLVYDLFNLRAFEYCWKIRQVQKRNAERRGIDYMESYFIAKGKVQIYQMIKRIQQSFKMVPI